ncbi:MAG TPA: MFS transporter, partial [Gemmataceae bacterium]|nr:MFS transporter [Gemmataceae bacterium]
GAAQAAALLYAWRNAVHAASSYPAGALSDRWGRRGLLALGFVLGGLTAVGFAVALPLRAGGLPLLVLLFTASGVSVTLVDALEGALTADVVPDESVRGLAYGVLGTVNGVGDFVSSALVGLLWSVNPALGFGYAALAMLLGAAFLRGLRLRIPAIQPGPNSVH